MNVLAPCLPLDSPLACPPACLPDAIERLLGRAELCIAPHERRIGFSAELAPPFTVDETGRITLGPGCLGADTIVLLRHALELALLVPRLGDAALAGLAAARVAAQFAQMRGLACLAPELGGAMPGEDMLRAAWGRLCRLQPGAAPGDAAQLEDARPRLTPAWPLLGPAEALLQSGGDQRLRVDPATGLNHYGCAHRPRPWAVTFASSTASSPSERGFAGAEAGRQALVLAALQGRAEAGLAAQADAMRAQIALLAGLPPGGAVVLAASGTDCELLALHLAGGARPVTNLLIAPEETGSGVPLAASGRHFLSDTARGTLVEKGAAIAGMAAGTELARVAARGADGVLRGDAAILAECAATVTASVAAGRDVILHLLDLAKTGYLAPSVAGVAAMAAAHPGRVRVVVDACQGRLSRERCAFYLGQGWVVLLTGSKFLTGPAFCGAVLVPPGLAGRLAVPVPAGLAAYSGRAEWPDGAATGALPAGANAGLVLRWAAALAEWRALEAVPEARRAQIVRRFGQRVLQGMAASPDVAALEVAGPARDGPECWDQVQTILGFVVRPHDPLDPEAARLVYEWLNADLRPALPAVLEAEAERLAGLRCHIGQPVALMLEGRRVGVLRISAGARLISGEPSHHDLDEEARLLREIRDALSVLDKVGLILTHWDALAASGLRPSF